MAQMKRLQQRMEEAGGRTVSEGETPVSRQALLSLSPRLSMAYAAAILLSLGFRSFLPATP